MNLAWQIPVPTLSVTYVVCEADRVVGAFEKLDAACNRALYRSDGVVRVMHETANASGSARTLFGVFEQGRYGFEFRRTADAAKEQGK